MVLEDPEWRGLPPAAKLFYLHLKAKYNGHNNGEIQLTYPELKGNNGLSAPDTISKAQIELIEKEWIVKTGNGGLMKNPNKFELTWKIDCLR